MSEPEHVRERIAAAIRDADAVLVTGHRNPDGDSIGSLIAMGLVMRALGKRYTLYGPDPVPYRFAQLPLAGEVVSRLDPEACFALSLVLDTGDEQQLGPDFPDEARRGRLAVLDHHSSARPFGELRWWDPAAAATGVLVAKLAETLGVPITAELAEPLWCALYTDTGGFRYASTDAAVLRLAASLVETGLSPWEISVKLYEQNPIERVQLLAQALNSLAVSSSGQIACLAITEAMLSVTGADHTMLDGIINYARGIAGVEVAVQVLQYGTNCRISMRSKGRVDVGQLAKRLGGGGHHNAGGCVLEGPPSEVQRLVLTLLQEELDRLYAAGR
jgi:phosphoesterase RecJ-like protein